MARIEKMARVVYKVEVQWECEFYEEILSRHPELKTQPVVRHSPLNTWDHMYGGRTEAIRLHYKISEWEETLQYVGVNSLYPYVCKYYKFPVGHPVIHVGDMSRQRGYVSKRGFDKMLRLAYHETLPSRAAFSVQ